MTILVTGGSGFIGSHLCRKLLEKGETVICIDNLFSGQEDHVIQLQHQNPSHFYFIKHNIIFPLKIKQKFLPVKEIYHLACPASPKYYQKDDSFTLDTCYIGTRNILNFALQQNAKILFTSTSEIYGEPLEHPQKEEYRGNVNPVGPRSCYDEGKRVAETLMYSYRKKGVDTKIARIFNTYGPNMRKDDGRVVSTFICQALKNKPMTIYGDGTQTRSFCYISDTVDGLIKLMNSSYQNPVNIGNPANEITMNTLATTIKEMIQSKSPIEFLPLPKNDPTRRCPDITKAKQILDWSPKMNLTKGLIHTIYYFAQSIE